MSECKWTPGPWRTQMGKHGQLEAWFIDTEGCREIATTAYFGDRANAHLIAAAPDLYEALEAAIDCGMVPKSNAVNGGAPKHSRQVHVADMIRAALARARGEA